MFEGGTLTCDVKGGAAVRHKCTAPAFVSAKGLLQHPDDREYAMMQERFEFWHLHRERSREEYPYSDGYEKR